MCGSRHPVNFSQPSAQGPAPTGERPRESARMFRAAHSPSTYAQTLNPGFARIEHLRMWKDSLRHAPSLEGSAPVLESPNPLLLNGCI